MEASMRIADHPILGPLEPVEMVTIYFDGTPVQARRGEPVAAALMNAGVKAFRKTPKRHEPRGIFCAIGRCTDCMMIVNGKPNTRTCVTLAEEGMVVQTQDGLA